MEQGPGSAYADLRENLLRSSAGEAGVDPGPGRIVWGVIMELRINEIAISTVALADGRASIHMENGGGIIGGGAHERVRIAASYAALVAEECREFTAPTRTFPLPEPDRITFYLLTDEGPRTGQAYPDELVEGRHELSPLFIACNDLITELRMISAAG